MWNQGCGVDKFVVNPTPTRAWEYRLRLRLKRRKRYSILKPLHHATHFPTFPFTDRNDATQRFAGVSAALPAGRVLLIIPMAVVGIIHFEFDGQHWQDSLTSLLMPFVSRSSTAIKCFFFTYALPRSFPFLAAYVPVFPFEYIIRSWLSYMDKSYSETPYQSRSRYNFTDSDSVKMIDSDRRQLLFGLRLCSLAYN